MQVLGFLIGVALGILALPALFLMVRLAIRFAGGTHHERNRRADGRTGRNHAVPAGGRCTPCSPAILLIAGSDGTPFRFDLTSSPVYVGRSPNNTLVITEDVPAWDTVSRHHALLYYGTRLGRWVVEDEGSQNGVYVNGVRTGHNVLRNDTSLAFGSVQALFKACPEPACPERGRRSRRETR